MSAATFRQIGDVAHGLVRHIATERDNLIAEMAAFTDPAWPTERIAERLQIPLEAARGIAVARVERRASGLFDFSQDSLTRAIICPCDYEDTEIGPSPLDLLAIFSDGSFALRLGIARWLGGGEIEARGIVLGPRFTAHDGERLAFSDTPLQIWRGPLNWLKAGRVGALPLCAGAFRDLAGFSGRIVAEDVKHGEEIRAAIAAPPIEPPEIVVPRRSAAE